MLLEIHYSHGPPLNAIKSALAGMLAKANRRHPIEWIVLK
jgi:hypothetical protein